MATVCSRINFSSTPIFCELYAQKFRLTPLASWEKFGVVACLESGGEIYYRGYGIDQAWLFGLCETNFDAFYELFTSHFIFRPSVKHIRYHVFLMQDAGFNVLVLL